VNVFVTGGTGFIGAHLVPALEARGDRVACLVRSPARAAALGWRAVRTVPGDLHDSAALREGCREAEVVFHLAGRIAARDLTEFMAANRDGTANLLEAAAAAPHAPRVVYVSSIAAAGPSRPGEPLDEGRVPAPVTDYGRSKLAGELLVRTSGLPWTVVRPPVVYGEWDREVLKVFRTARRGLGVVFRDGTQELSVVYAGDLARGLIAAGTAAAAAGKTYFAAHPTPTTSAGLVRAIGRAVGREVRIARIPAPLGRGLLWIVGSLAHLAGRATVLSLDKANEFLAPAWTCRVQAIARDVGWRAETDLEAGLRQTAEWYRAKGWLS
jgi:nucleoside-diphosphate-sugar epimerase